MSFSSERKCVLVAGGTGGIGGALCAVLSSNGYTPVVGYAQSISKAEEIARSTSGIPLHCDLSSPASIDAVISALNRLDGDLEGIIFASSLPPRLKKFELIDVDFLKLQLQINTIGPSYLCAMAIRDIFSKRKKGFIVGLLSSAVEGKENIQPEFCEYSIAKFAMKGMLAQIKSDYRWLKVLPYSPNYTDTQMLNAFDPRIVELLRVRNLIQSCSNVAVDIFRSISHE